MLCEHADAAATTSDYEFEDGRTLKDALDTLNGHTRRLRQILSGDLPNPADPPPRFAANVVQGRRYDLADPEWSGYFTELLQRLLGRPAEVVWLDEPNPQGAQQNAERLVGEHKVVGIVDARG